MLSDVVGIIGISVNALNSVGGIGISAVGGIVGMRLAHVAINGDSSDGG